MNLRLASTTFVALGLLATGPAIADSFQTFAGSTVNAPRWNRVVQSGPNIRTSDMVRYRVQPFNLSGPADCTIYNTQDFDGYMHLYAGSFNPTNQLNNLIEGDDDAETGVGSSRMPQDLDSNSLSLTGGNYFIVTSGFDDEDEGNYQIHVQCNGNIQPAARCFISGYDRPDNTCLRDQFPVVIDQVNNHATDGVATPVRFASTDSAFYWFFNPVNYEVMVKVINGCAVNGNWWVFIAGTTNQGHRIRVGDLATQTIKNYTRGTGPPAPAITDTNAFPCI